jgi:hypothetical protein
MNGTSRPLLVLLLASTSLLAAGHIATPDGHLRIAQARAWLENRSLELPSDVGNPEHGNVAVTSDGRRYAVYAPGQSALLVPLVLLAHSLRGVSPYDYHYVAAFFASFVGPVGLALSGWVLFHVARELGAKEARALGVALALVFGTCALPHAMDGYEHIPEMLCLMTTFYLLLLAGADRHHGKVRRLAIAAGALTGLGFLIRYSAAFAVPAFLLLMRGRRQTLAFALGLVPFVAVALLYNAARFGSAFETGYALAWPLERPITPVLGEAFSLARIPRALVGLWISPGKGMFWYSPILLGALVAWPAFTRLARAPATAAIALTLSYSLVYASNFAWHGSAWCWGPRYLVPTLPFMLLGLLGFQRLRGWSAAFVSVVVAISIAVQWPALLTDYRRPLIERYRENAHAFDSDEVFFRVSASPLLAQIRTLPNTLFPDARCDGRCEAYIAPGPWKTEARPASTAMMLDHSIDLNVPNLWWWRMMYLPVPPAVRIGSEFIAGALLLAALSAACVLCMNVTGRSLF